MKLVRPPVLGLFAGILLVAAAACGGDDETSPPARSDPSDPSAVEQSTDEAADEVVAEPAQQAGDDEADEVVAEPAQQTGDDEDVEIGATAAGLAFTDCETQIGAGVPEFYSRYFRCVRIDLDGDSVRITSDNLPPHPSFYYGEGHALFEAFDFSRGADYRPNPNEIGGTGFVLRIPLQPVGAGVTIDATSVNAATGDATDYPFGAAGVALDGVVLFNPLAAPGEDIAEERFTFDSNEGHPQRDGIYHYHAVSPGPLAVLQALGFTTSAVPGASEIELYGIMCDGTVVMGEVELDGTAVAGALDLQAGHVHDLVDGDGVVLLANRYHVHMAAEIGTDPRGLTPEAQFYAACVVS